jgi:hypothetical protein
VECPRVVNESGLERCRNLHEPLDGQFELCMLRGKRVKRLFDELAGEGCKCRRASAWCEDEDIPGIQGSAAAALVERGVEVNVQRGCP